MLPAAETSWSASLLTAASFLGLLIAGIFGVLASVSGNGASLEYGLAIVCAASFVTHLQA